MTSPRRRILVSVSPRILRDTLQQVLGASGVDDVVAVDPGLAGEGMFDGAIVSAGSTVEADVVIELPDEFATDGILRTDGTDQIIDLRDLAGLVRVLDQYLAGPTSRAAWLADDAECRVGQFQDDTGSTGLGPVRRQ